MFVRLTHWKRLYHNYHLQWLARQGKRTADNFWKYDCGDGSFVFISSYRTAFICISREVTSLQEATHAWKGLIVYVKGNTDLLGQLSSFCLDQKTIGRELFVASLERSRIEFFVPPAERKNSTPNPRSCKDNFPTQAHYLTSLHWDF